MRCKLHRIAVDRDPTGAGIEANRAAGELALGVARRTAQQRAHARQYFFEVKRLGNVVVGTGVEALHLVAPAIPRGEDQNGHGPAGPPPGLEHRDAVHLGQANIQDHGVVRFALAEIVSLFTVESAIDDVARIRECGRELPIEIGIVLDNKKPQGIAPLSARRPGCL